MKNFINKLIERLRRKFRPRRRPASPPLPPRQPLSFLDLPPEIRVRILSYAYKANLPIVSVRKLRELVGSAGAQLRRDLWYFNADWRLHAAEIMLRQKTVFVDLGREELGDVVMRIPQPFARRIRHVHLARYRNAERLINTLRDQARYFEHYDILDMFDSEIRDRIDHRFSLPVPANFARLDSRWLPNLQTLTLDVGRIDEIPVSCWYYNYNGWPTWLDESEVDRNARYRTVLQQVHAKIPQRTSNSLKIIVNASVDPKPPLPLYRRRMGTRPILRIKLEYKVAEPSIVAIKEEWDSWDFECIRGPFAGNIFVVDGKEETGQMDWDVSAGQFYESTVSPPWWTLGGDLVLQEGVIMEMDESFDDDDEDDDEDPMQFLLRTLLEVRRRHGL